MQNWLKEQLGKSYGHSVYCAATTLRSLACYPKLLPYNFVSVSEWIDRPNLRPLDRWSVPVFGADPRNLAAFGSLVEEGGELLRWDEKPPHSIWLPGVPTVLDIDGVGLEQIPFVRSCVEAFRSTCSSPLSVNPLRFLGDEAISMEMWASGITKGQRDLLFKTSAPLKDLVKSFSFVMGGAYMSLPQYLERDLAGYLNYNKLIAEFWQMPVHLVINPRYIGFKHLTVAVGKKLLDMGKLFAATVIWCEEEQPVFDVFGSTLGIK